MIVPDGPYPYRDDNRQNDDDDDAESHVHEATLRREAT
jgi:hypothetical protein